jgi:hypothetical protein
MTPIIKICAFLSKELQKEFLIDVQKFLLTEKKCHLTKHAEMKLIKLILLLENKEKESLLLLCVN